MEGSWTAPGPGTVGQQLPRRAAVPAAFPTSVQHTPTARKRPFAPPPVLSKDDHVTCDGRLVR